MPAASADSLAGAQKTEMLQRQLARDQAEADHAGFLSRVEAIKEKLGKAYRRDLILQPPMYAAQDLQTGYGTRQERTATEIEAVEFPRLCRVLEAAGFVLVDKKDLSGKE